MATEAEIKLAADKNKSDPQAGKLDALIADIDFSDVPEAIRNDVIAKMKEKVKLNLAIGALPF